MISQKYFQIYPACPCASQNKEFFIPLDGADSGFWERSQLPRAAPPILKNSLSQNG
jgi:hypothetical protein